LGIIDIPPDSPAFHDEFRLMRRVVGGGTDKDPRAVPVFVGSGGTSAIVIVLNRNLVVHDQFCVRPVKYHQGRFRPYGRDKKIPAVNEKFSGKSALRGLPASTALRGGIRGGLSQGKACALSGYSKEGAAGILSAPHDGSAAAAGYQPNMFGRIDKYGFGKGYIGKQGNFVRVVRGISRRGRKGFGKGGVIQDFAA
jgi:hypothetical protein